MSTYAIGDVQGCFAELISLLDKINFDKSRDQLWFVGDLVNRGPQSLEVLRFVKSLGSGQKTVLGNHDLHLIALAYGKREQRKTDTLEPILLAPDKDELITWLRYCPLFHYEPTLQYAMVHAGLASSWDLNQAQTLAQEVESVLQSHSVTQFLENMYGNTPCLWNDQLQNTERLRCIINYFTRMRFCYADGRLDFSYQGDLQHKPKELLPWFELPNRKNDHDNIIFGHWAALNGHTNIAHLYPLDTGCVWGGHLTAFRLEDQKRFSVPSTLSKIKKL